MRFVTLMLQFLEIIMSSHFQILILYLNVAEVLREVSTNAVQARKNASKELELVDELLKNYDVNVRPYAQRARPPIVEMDLAIIQILEIVSSLY